MVITDKFQYIVPVAVMMLEGFLWFDYFYATYIDLHIIWYHNGIHINHPFSITIDDGMKLMNYEISKPSKMAKYKNRPIFCSSVTVVHMIKLN